MYKLLNVLAICLIFSGTAKASESIYSGPPLSIDYDGPILVDNSQYRYTSDDRLGFSTSDWLTAQYSNLLPLRPIIDSWSARLSIHPKVLSAVLNGYFDGTQTLADSLEIEAVVQVASALATVYAQQSPDPLAASQAVMATATALSFTLELPPELAQQRSILGLKAAPVLNGYFQPPWEIGDTWAGGGAHSENHSALDFWGEYRNWGADVSQWWVTAMQAGMVRVYSSCDIDVIHPNGWVTGYYHLENIQVSDGQFVERNDRLANYANDIAQALCSGGSSSGPHVHMSLSYNGERISVDESQVDFTAFSHHEGVGDYDTNCSRSWYTHFSQGQVCPNYDDLLNDAPLPDAQPEASFTVTPLVGEAPLTVTVDASASNGSGIRYLWDFGDGATATQVSTTHTFTEVGDYTISLTVTDDNGMTDTTTNSVRATSPIIFQDNFESGVLSDVTDVWQVVNLNHDYTSMVVIASVNRFKIR